MSSALGFSLLSAWPQETWEGVNGSKWGHIWGLHTDSEASRQVSTPPWSIQNHSPNRTMATLQPPPAVLPLPGTPHPQSAIQEGTPRYLSQAYHLSSLSAPVSSSAHS